jgi:phage tail sheath protein FI
MGFQVSPGVEVKEIDLTNVIPAVSTSIGGYAGRFRWGPINEIRLIGSESGLVNVFGKPNTQYARPFFTAASFLNYGDALKTVRAEETDVMNASSGTLENSISALSVDSQPGTYTSVSDLYNNVIVADDTGSGAIIKAQYAIKSVTVANGGTDYTTGDVISVTIDGVEVKYDVTASAGAVTSLALQSGQPGLVFSAPDAFVGSVTSNLSVTVANAAGLTVSIDYDLADFVVVNGGSGYTGSIAVMANGTDIAANVTATIVAGVADRELIKNSESFEAQQSGLTDDVYSRYAGVLGNKTKVYFLNSVNFASHSKAGEFDFAPDADTEVHVLVTTTAKEFTGDNSENAELVTEKWTFLGVDSEAKTEDGGNNFYADVLNKSSNWVYVPSAIDNVATNNEAASTIALVGGTDGSVTRDPGMITTALDLLSDSEIEDVNLLFTEDDTGNVATLGNYVLGIATSRKDCVAFVSPQIADTVNNTTPLVSVKAYKNLLSAPDSYGVIGSGAAYVYNRYTDKYLWIGTQGHLAGLCANTDDVAEPWFSPAGFNRGNLRGVAKLSYNPKKIDRDELYKAGINPIVTMPGEGTLLYGDKTLQSKPSAFDRINVRRLFIVLEKAIATAAKYQLFELNDEFTRATFRNAVEPFLRDVRGRRGVTDFMVVCDETNNTGEVIDTNRFVADIYIKPARSINFITLNFIATRTGVDFSEVAGLSNA